MIKIMIKIWSKLWQKYDQNYDQNMIYRHKWKWTSKKKGEQQNLHQNQLLCLDNWGVCKLKKIRFFNFFLQTLDFFLNRQSHSVQIFGLLIEEKNHQKEIN